MTDRNKNVAIRLAELKQQDPILLIGSGLSIPPYWHWAGLLGKICEQMGVSEPSERNPLTCAQILYKGNPIGYGNAISNLFREMPSACRPALLHIANIGFKSVLTTNFDRTIELAYYLAGKEVPDFLVYPRLVAALCEAGSIHYIHGRVHPDPLTPPDIILHHDSYQRSYFDEPKTIPNYLFQVLLSNHIIFTGYSLAPAEPMNYIIEALMDFTTSATSRSLAKKFTPKTRLMLLPSGEVEEDARHRLSGLGIEILEYEKLDVDHRGLDEVWHEVRKRTGSSYQLPETPLDPFSKIPNKAQ